MLIQLETHSSKPKPRSLFYSYAHKDEAWRDELDAHLAVLKREGFIASWHDRKIRPGEEWDASIHDALDRADLILFLVSSHFLDSSYCRGVEVRRAMERHRRKEALVIPIILTAVALGPEEFASLQALPKNYRPLAEWPEAGFAAVAEDLRTLLVDLSFPRTPEGDTRGHHGSWILKLECRPHEDNRQRAARILSRLQDFTSDYSIAVQATSITQVADGDRLTTGLMVILSGSAEAFSAIDKAQQAGTLSAVLNDQVLQFYLMYGATVQGVSIPSAATDASYAERSDLRIGPGRKMVPAMFRGMTVSKGNGTINFQFHRGDDEWAADPTRAGDYRKLLDYFKTSVAVKDGRQWVNLSAFEADRMLPKELAGTGMGRALLAQDCILKRLTASLMHPDHPVGRQYWDAVYEEAYKRLGSSKMPFQSFQKVWMVPSQALVFEADGDAPEGDPENTPEETRSLMKTIAQVTGLGPGKVVAYILKSEIEVQCEADLVARNAIAGDTEINSAEVGGPESDFALDLFKDIVLPRIREEVNEGEYFAEMRQMYSAMMLATWVKHSLSKLGHAGLQTLADSGDPGCLNVDLSTIQRVGTEEGAQNPVPPPPGFESAFDVPENIEYYQTYVDLFRNGVFHCARNEPGDEPGERIVRVYFSGAIDCRERPLRVRTTLAPSARYWARMGDVFIAGEHPAAWP
jgi:hypothetical protein